MYFLSLEIIATFDTWHSHDQDKRPSPQKKRLPPIKIQETNKTNMNKPINNNPPNIRVSNNTSNNWNSNKT